MTERKRTIFLVDDDAAVRRGVSALLSAGGYSVAAFIDAHDFLKRLNQLDLNGAILLVDVLMPGISGLELQSRLCEEQVPLPVVVMTAHGDVPMAMKAMRAGAADFVEKPFTAEEILGALERAAQQHMSSSRPPREVDPDTKARYDRLSKRETQVFRAVAAGLANKEIARVLQISARTVEVHRTNVMRKMAAANLAHLVRMAVCLDLD